MDKSRQAELKREYKETPRAAGVYMIKHTVTGRMFIGSSVDVNARINRHKAEFAFVGNGVKSISELAEDVKMHGREGIVYEVLDVLDDDYDSRDKLIEDLAALELMWRERMQPSGDREDSVRGA